MDIQEPQKKNCLENFEQERTKGEGDDGLTRVY